MWNGCSEMREERERGKGGGKEGRKEIEIVE
jgi:hypothetical protein